LNNKKKLKYFECFLFWVRNKNKMPTVNSKEMPPVVIATELMIRLKHKTEKLMELAFDEKDNFEEENHYLNFCHNIHYFHSEVENFAKSFHRFHMSQLRMPAWVTQEFLDNQICDFGNDMIESIEMLDTMIRHEDFCKEKLVK